MSAIQKINANFPEAQQRRCCSRKQMNCHAKYPTKNRHHHHYHPHLKPPFEPVCVRKSAEDEKQTKLWPHNLHSLLREERVTPLRPISTRP